MDIKEKEEKLDLMILKDELEKLGLSFKVDKYIKFVIYKKNRWGNKKYAKVNIGKYDPYIEIYGLPLTNKKVKAIFEDIYNIKLEIYIEEDHPVKY